MTHKQLWLQTSQLCWGITHSQMSHGTVVNASWHTHQLVMAHTCDCKWATCAMALSRSLCTCPLSRACNIICATWLDHMHHRVHIQKNAPAAHAFIVVTQPVHHVQTQPRLPHSRIQICDKDHLWCDSTICNHTWHASNMTHLCVFVYGMTHLYAITCEMLMEHTLLFRTQPRACHVISATWLLHICHRGRGTVIICDMTQLFALYSYVTLLHYMYSYVTCL